MIRSLRARIFGKKPIDKRLYDEADPYLVEQIRRALHPEAYEFEGFPSLAGATGGSVPASSVPSDIPCFPVAGDVEPNPFGAVAPSCGATVPGACPNNAGDTHPKPERDWRWAPNSLPLHSNRIIGDD